MYKIAVHSNANDLHVIFESKLLRYGFTKVGNNDWVSENTVDDLAGVMFYKKNLCGPTSPLSVTAKRTERIV